MVLTPRASFLSLKKKVTRRFRGATYRKVYFYHLFLKVLLWTREMRLWQPCVNFFGKKSDLPVQITKSFIQKMLLQESFSKCSSGHVGYSFENHALLFCWKAKLFLLKIRTWQKNYFSMLVFAVSLPHERKSLFWHNWLKNCKTTKNCSI